MTRDDIKTMDIETLEKLIKASSTELLEGIQALIHVELRERDDELDKISKPLYSCL